MAFTPKHPYLTACIAFAGGFLSGLVLRAPASRALVHKAEEGAETLLAGLKHRYLEYWPTDDSAWQTSDQDLLPSMR